MKIVMLSGGPDSATVLHQLARSEDGVRAIVFDFGQQSSAAEIAAARRQAIRENVSIEAIDVSGLRRSFLGFAPELTIGLGFKDSVGHQIGNCPHGLFGLATSYALLNKADGVAIGMHKEDHGDPKEVTSFLAEYSQGISTLHGVDFTLSAPLIDMTKVEVLKLAATYGIPLEETWSCSRGQHEQCGECKECLKRKAAFVTAGIDDRTPYGVR